MARHRWLALLVSGPMSIVAIPACRAAKPSIGTSSGSSSANTAMPPSSPATTIKFIEDAYPEALAEAKARGKPLFVDVWASWCHTCMSMKAYVLPAPEMQAMATKLVWSAIDSEKLENAEFLERFPNMVLPTLWVIDPAEERPLLKWVGAATAPELALLLEDAVSPAPAGADLGEASAAMVRGDQATAAARSEDAMIAYGEALAKAPLGWARRPRVVEALSLRLVELERNAECVELAVREIPRLPPGTPLVSVTVNGLGAAAGLPAGDPALDHVPFLVREATRIVEDPAQPVLVDDRSGLFKALVAAWHDANPAEAKRLARGWANILEAAALGAGSRERRAVWDPHRLEAYIALGEVEKAIPMLEQSERDFPEDYSTPARLARAYLELRRPEPALAAVTRALARAYGPRKLNLLMLKADILLFQNDRPAARRAIGEAIQLAAQPKLPVKYHPLRRRLAQRLAELR